MENSDTTAWTSTLHAEGEPVTETVLRAVAERKGCSQLQLPLLYDCIDPDALNTLVASAEEPSVGGSLVVEFEYAEYAVRVTEGSVELRALHPPARPVVELGQAD